MFNLIKKYFSIVFIILFVIIFTILNSEEYVSNYENKIWEAKENEEVNKNIKTFKLENINPLVDTHFYYTPYKKLLDKIVDKILNAETRVYLEVYMLTETRIKQALIDVKNNWKEVKVILEKNPYKANSINNKHFKFLKDAWVNIVWSNPDLYSLNHSKFIIIDDEIILSTWNFTYSTFAFNRDLFLFSKDKILLDNLLIIFDWDFLWKNINVYSDNLVLSPSYSRNKFETLFSEAEFSIDLYFQYLSDEKLEKLLIKKALEWVKIKIIVSEDFYKDEKEKINNLIKVWIEIQPLLEAKNHSKAILIDSKYLFIGSVNFSGYSLDKNREIWVILTNEDIISKYMKLFIKDFAN